MPIGGRTAAYFRAPERTDVHPWDTPIPRFVMMGSGVRIPSCAPALSSDLRAQNLRRVSVPEWRFSAGIGPNDLFAVIAWTG